MTTPATVIDEKSDEALRRSDVSRHRRRIVSEAFWVSTGQAIGAIGSVFGVRVLTHILPPSAFGELALGMTVATLGLQILLAPLTTAALRFFAPAQEKKELSSFIAAVRHLLVRAAGLIAIAAGVTTAGLALAGAQRFVPLALSAFAYAVISGTNSVLDGMQNASRQRLTVAWHDGIAPWARFGLAAVFVSMFHRPTSAIAMTGYAAASLLVLLSQYVFFRLKIAVLVSRAFRLNDEVREGAWRAQMLQYGWPFALWGVFTWAQLASDRWALGSLVSIREVGLYAAIYQLGFYPVLMLSQVLTQLAAPMFFEAAGDGTDVGRLERAIRINQRFLIAVLGITVAGVIIGFGIHGFIGRLLLAPEYRAASHLLPWIALSGGLYASGQVAALVFMTANRVQAITLPKIAAALAGVTMNFVGAYLFGAAGVIAAGVIASGGYCLWLTGLAAKQKFLGITD